MGVIHVILSLVTVSDETETESALMFIPLLNFPP